MLVARPGPARGLSDSVAQKIRHLAACGLLFFCATLHAQAPQLPLSPASQPTAPAPPSPVPAIRPAQASRPALTPADVSAFLDGLIPEQLQRDDVAGATVSVTLNGQALLERGYGYADWKKKTPVDPVRTTFRPGSISKLFTYVAMMQLVEQGRLALDTPVSQYLDFPLRPGPRGIGDAPITLRQLCTHTAGFEETFHDFGSDRSGRLPVDLRTYLVRNQPHRFAPPGKRLAYSNYGISLVGYIVQRASGERFQQYVDRHILQPLGMVHSTFEQPLPAGFAASLGYQATKDPDTGFEGVDPVPAGALSSTAADMSRFGQMLLGTGGQPGSLDGKTVLQPASVALLFSPQFAPAPGVAPWDLGFYTVRRNGLDFIGHGGDLIACHSQFWVEPKHGLTFFISYNSAGSAKDAREELFRAFVDRYLPGAPAPHPAYVSLSGADLRAYTGWYQSARRSDATRSRAVGLSAFKQVATKDGYLTFSTAKDPRGELLAFHPIGNDSFYEEAGQATLHFERDARGRIVGYASPGWSDRMHLPGTPTFLNLVILFTTMTLLAVLLGPLTRVWRRIFYRRRSRAVPQAGTRWLTRPVQVAALLCFIAMAQFFGTLVHAGHLPSFYSVGHLDRWFAVGNVLACAALLAVLFAVGSALRVLAQPVRFITRLKFAIVLLALLSVTWLGAYLHVIGPISHY